MVSLVIISSIGLLILFYHEKQNIMGATQSNTANLINQSVTNAAQTSIQTCQSQGTAQVNNSGIIINGSRVGGNVGIVAASVVTQQCTMNNTLSSDVSNILNNLAQQEEAQEASFLNWFSKQNNSVNSTNTIVNNISQVLSTTCSSTSASSVNNANIDIIGADVGGNVSIASTTSVNNQCNMVNSGKIAVFNDLQNNIKQKQTQLDLFGLIAMAIIAVIAIIFVIIIVLVIGSILKGGGGKTQIVGSGGSTGSAGSDQSGGLLQLAEIKALMGGGKGETGAVGSAGVAEGAKAGGALSEAGTLAEEAALL